ncbi:MAG: methyltransferase domain-containing protein [Chitinophagaceae bacterium]|nr:MAG: methyltransferase domain-containing protein [Chitinophagaceae bacterium]
MIVHRLKSLSDYITHVEKNRAEYARRVSLQQAVTVKGKKEFKVRAISYPADSFVDLQVDYQYGNGEDINWRERLVCPVTGLNNRLRASVHVLDMELEPYPESIIYVTEQVTPLFSFLQQRYAGLRGSEFLGPDMEPGTIVNGINHEDMRNLSLGTGSTDLYLSFECLEHIPHYERVFPEMYRVLRSGGMFMGTFPFDINADSNLVKAREDPDGTITYLTEPEYHGDPVNGDGILCYTVFGWEVLEQLKKAGFRDAYVLLLWSDVYGYLGGEQSFIVAKK